MFPYEPSDPEEEYRRHHHHHHHHSPPPSPPPEDPYHDHHRHHPPRPEAPFFPEQAPPYPPQYTPPHLPHEHGEYPPSFPPPQLPHGQVQYPTISVQPAYSVDVELPRGQLVKVFSKADRDYNLAARHDGVVLLPANPRDETQQWIKDDTHGMRVKDSYGFPAFSLVNKALKKVLKHAKEKGQQVLLADYQPGVVDDDILWTESQDFGEGYKTIRMASDTLLNLTVFHGDRKSGGVKTGSPIILDTWHKQDSQMWKIFPLTY